MNIVRCWCCACLSGSIINWFKTNLVAPDVSYDALNSEAERLPAGCEGLLCIDHFQVNFRHIHAPSDDGMRALHPGLVFAYLR